MTTATRGLRFFPGFNAPEWLQCHSAHHALDRSVGQALATTRTALRLLVGSRLLSEEPHRAPSVSLADIRGWLLPFGASMHKTPQLCLQ
jgi:hypothetical protein